jgi:hypothetical protein
VGFGALWAEILILDCQPIWYVVVSAPLFWGEISPLWGILTQTTSAKDKSSYNAFMGMFIVPQSTPFHSSGDPA